MEGITNGNYPFPPDKVPPKREGKVEREYKTFPGISKYAFQHPDDLKATVNLKKLLPVREFLKLLAESVLDKVIYTLKISDSIMVTPKQAPYLWKLYEKAGEILDVPRLPTLFLSYSSSPPEVFGIERYFISISPFYIDRMREPELMFVLGKMLSWLKLDHMPYITAVQTITTFGQIIASSVLRMGRLLMGPIEMPLLAWKRVAEFSTDRGGLLVAQDLEAAQSAIVKLTGFSFKYMGKVNFEELERQVHESLEMENDLIASLVKNYYQVRSAEPFAILRIKELSKFYYSEDYRRILRGEYMRVEEEKSFEEMVIRNTLEKLPKVQLEIKKKMFCPNCGFPLEGTYRFCPNCGYDLSNLNLPS